MPSAGRRPGRDGWVCTVNQEGCGMSVRIHEAGGLAPGIVGSARVTAFGTSFVAPAVSVISVLIVMMSYAGFASPLLVAGEMDVIAALAITILVKTGPAHYSAAVFSPASAPSGQFSDFTNAMIYGITAFAGFEAAAALGEEARNTR